MSNTAEVETPVVPKSQHHWGKRFFRGCGGAMLWGGWHAIKNGRRISITTSLIEILLIYIFFVLMRGWTPSPTKELMIAHYVGWGVMIVLAIQVTLAGITSGGGSRPELWIDIAITLLPALLIMIIMVLHRGHFVPLPLEQARYGVSVAIGAWADFLSTLAINMLSLSRLPAGGASR